MIEAVLNATADVAATVPPNEAVGHVIVAIATPTWQDHCAKHGESY